MMSEWNDRKKLRYQNLTDNLFKNYILSKEDILPFVKKLKKLMDDDTVEQTRDHIYKMMEKDRDEGSVKLFPDNGSNAQEKLRVEKTKSFMFFKLAESFCKECLDLRVATFGKSHPDTLFAMNNLALIYFCQMLDAKYLMRNQQFLFPYYDPYDTSREKQKLVASLFKECLDLRISSLGKSHPDTLQSMSNLAVFYVTLREYNLAEPLQKECLELRKTTLGRSHTATLFSMNNLAIIYDNLKSYPLAESLYKECLDLRRSTLGDTHPDTLQSDRRLTVFNNKNRKFSNELFFSFPTEILFRILDFTNKKELGQFDNAAVGNRSLRERWINLKKSFMRLFRNMFLCDKTLTGHDNIVYAIIELSDGRIASNSSDKTIKIWNLVDYSCERTLSGHTDSVYGLIDIGEGRIVSSSQDTTIKIWNRWSGKCERTLSGHRDSVGVLIHLNNGRIASASDDKSIKIWNIENGSCEKTLSGPSFVYSLIQLTDGRLVSGNGDNTTKIWNVDSGLCERTITGSDFICALIQLDDARIASATRYGIMIDIWNLESGVKELSLSGYNHEILNLLRLIDGRIASSSRDKTIKIWNVATGACEGTLVGHTAWVPGLIQLGDGRIVSGGGDKTIKIWSLGV